MSYTELWHALITRHRYNLLLSRSPEFTRFLFDLSVVKIEKKREKQYSNFGTHVVPRWYEVVIITFSYQAETSSLVAVHSPRHTGSYRFTHPRFSPFILARFTTHDKKALPLLFEAFFATIFPTFR